MILYEINEAITRLTDRLDADSKDEEVCSAVADQIHALDMERHAVLEGIAKLILNLRAEAGMLRAEEQRLKARRDVLSRKENRLMKILDRECDGQKTPLGIATFSYRKTSHVEVSDPEKAMKWLKRRNYTNCFHVPAPEIAKTEVKRLITSGNKVPGCAVVEDRSYTLK